MPLPSLILRGGRVATPLAPDGFVEAIAISEGVISALGSNVEIDALRAPSTRVIDLKGRLAIPAFGDAHVHAISGGLESQRCNLLGLTSRSVYLERIAAYSALQPVGGWVLGGGWSLEAFPGGVPTAADLDLVCGGRPAFLPNRDHHSAWVNTAALERAGIDARTPDPLNGRIERLPDGSPSGALHESAMALVARHLPSTSREEMASALRTALKTLHGYGITHWQDACVGDAGDIGVVDTYDAYRTAAHEGWLTARVRGALWWDRSKGLEQIDYLLGRRETSPNGQFRATSVKMMVDGVCEMFTAAMSRAYLGEPGRNGTHRGDLFIDCELLIEAVRALDDEGFQVHFHAIGDRAITTALDAVESADEKRRGANRHHIAHLQFIDPHELDRFSRLGVTANFQPLWACSDPQMEDFTIPYVGEDRIDWQYSIASLQRLRTRIAFGSDWPVSSPNPLEEIHVAVNRCLSTNLGRPDTDETTKPFRPEERISVAEALAAFTTGVAYVNGDENMLGVLDIGRQADVAILNQDIFAIPTTEIGYTNVDVTVAAGTVVHGDE